MADKTTSGARSAATKVKDWFNGGDPDGRAKIGQWARGYDADRPEGYTFGMMGPAMVLSVIAALLYKPTHGYGSIVALLIAVFLVIVRHIIEGRVAAAVGEIIEGEDQYKRTRNAEYVEFVELRASGLAEENKMLTSQTREWLQEQVEWARTEKERNERRSAKKAQRQQRKHGGPQHG